MFTIFNFCANLILETLEIGRDLAYSPPNTVPFQLQRKCFKKTDFFVEKPWCVDSSGQKKSCSVSFHIIVLSTASESAWQSTEERSKSLRHSAVGREGFMWSCREHKYQSIKYYSELLMLQPLARFTFRVIALLFDFSPLNQIDQDIHRKYTLSSDAELILIRSLTLGKVISKSSNLRKSAEKLAALLVLKPFIFACHHSFVIPDSV